MLSAGVDNLQQIAAVRLRLEGVPMRTCHSHEFDSWPFSERTCVVFCRTTMRAGERAPTDVVVVDSVTCGYVLSDGIERNLRDVPGSHELHAAALALRGITAWMSSGGSI